MIVRGIGRGYPPGSDACERKGSWDSIRACHGDEDVAAGGGLWGAWQGEESSNAKARAVEKVGRDAWAASASRRWPPGRPRAAAALNSGGDRESREAGRRWKMTGLLCNFRKFQGSYCKTKITSKLGLKKKVPNMKVVQFFKIYNFDVVQKMI